MGVYYCKMGEGGYRDDVERCVVLCTRECVPWVPSKVKDAKSRAMRDRLNTAYHM